MAFAALAQQAGYTQIPGMLPTASQSLGEGGRNGLSTADIVMRGQHNESGSHQAAAGALGQLARGWPGVKVATAIERCIKLRAGDNAAGCALSADEVGDQPVDGNGVDTCGSCTTGCPLHKHFGSHPVSLSRAISAWRGGKQRWQCNGGS